MVRALREEKGCRGVAAPHEAETMEAGEKMGASAESLLESWQQRSWDEELFHIRTFFDAHDRLLSRIMYL